MPPKSKHKIQTTLDKRHEIGLAAPIKPSGREKATVVNGHADIPSSIEPEATSTSIMLPIPGKIHHSTSQFRLPSTGLNQGLTFPRPASSSIDVESVVATATRRQDKTSFHPTEDFENLGPAGNRPVQPSTPKAASFSPNFRNTALSTGTDTLHRLAAQANQSVTLASTILASCPLRDALALLIVLLSLPPSLVLAVQALFAAMGFVPANLSGLSIGLPSFLSWSWSEWFIATPSGGASPFTIILLDVIISTLYLVFPLYMQEGLMDIANAVIAISLSGASAGSSGSYDSVVFCAVAGGFLRAYRNESLHRIMLDNLKTIAWRLGYSFDAEGHFSAFKHQFEPVTIATHGWPRVLLSCHILAQGLHALTRRLLAGASRPRPDTRPTSECPTPIDDMKNTVSSPGSSTGNVIWKQNSEPATPTTSLSQSVFKDRAPNSKRRRKQANQVRSQQPLWAAIASTKITFLKEVELKQASSDALETSARTESSRILPLLMQDRLQVREISSTAILVAVEIVDIQSQRVDDTTAEAEGQQAVTAENIKPFFVRLNGADWNSTRITQTRHNISAGDISRSYWDGEIYGLTPLTKYSCEIIRTRDDRVIGSVNLITSPSGPGEAIQSTTGHAAASAHAAKSSPSVASTQPSLRPLSPTSTLRQSLAAGEARREELRARLKRIRKDNKNVVAALRKDIEQLQHKMSSTTGNDEKNKSKVTQLERNIKQAEDAAEQLTDELAILERIPTQEAEEHSLERQAWQAAQESKDVALHETALSREQCEREISSFGTDLASLTTKRDRLVHRRKRLDEQIEEMMEQQNREFTARQIHEQERAVLVAERENAGNKMIHWINETRSHTEQMITKSSEYIAQTDAMKTRIQQLQSEGPNAIAPEGVRPNVAGLGSYDASQALGSNGDGFFDGGLMNGRLRNALLSSHRNIPGDLEAPNESHGPELS